MGVSTGSVIVVGVDGSPASSAALAFALGEGVRRNSVIDIVTAWDVVTGWAGAAPGLSMLQPADAREDRAQEVQDAAVAAVLGAHQVTPVLSRQVVQGDAAEVLVRAASVADYLVVGTGRRGILRRGLLGSVSEFCVRQARCPVVVVPGPQVFAYLGQPDGVLVPDDEMDRLAVDRRDRLSHTEPR